MTTRVFFGIAKVVWDVHFSDFTIDHVNAIVPLQSSWEAYYTDGHVEWTEQEFSNYRRLDVASDVLSKLGYH